MAVRPCVFGHSCVSDANSIYAPNALRSLVRSFADPSVGYVTGQMIYTNPDESGIGEGSSAYMRLREPVAGFGDETRLDRRSRRRD